MKNNTQETNTVENKNIDWVEIIFGILSIVAGVIIFSNLYQSYIGLALVFGILLIVRAIVLLIRNIRLKNYTERKTSAWIGIVLAVLLIIMGIYLSFNQAVSLVVIGNLAGIYFIVEGVFNIYNSVKFQMPFFRGFSIFSIILNIFMIIAGIMMLGNWLVGGLTISALIGINAILLGIFIIIEGATD